MEAMVRFPTRIILSVMVSKLLEHFAFNCFYVFAHITPKWRLIEMTHAEIITNLISEYAGVAVEEATFAFATFRAQFPEPEGLDRNLSKQEEDAMFSLYRENPDLVREIAKTIAKGPGNLPTV